jgi:hypothetical protein
MNIKTNLMKSNKLFINSSEHKKSLGNMHEGGPAPVAQVLSDLYLNITACACEAPPPILGAVANIGPYRSNVDWVGGHIRPEFLIKN